MNVMKWSWRVLVVPITVTVLSVSIVGGAMAAPHGSDDRVIVRGRATLDGVVFDAPYLGAVVVRHGLVTPCQRALPEVRAGRFEITVFARTEALGCGASGGEIYLWTFVQDQIIFSSESVRWPGRGATASFTPSFSIAAPNGGVGPTVGFAGEVFDRRGTRMPPGTRVEAYIGTTRCAVASVRRSGNFTGFSIDVVGPDAIPSCMLGATITFRVNDQPARETAINQPGQDSSLNLELA